MPEPLSAEREAAMQSAWTAHAERYLRAACDNGTTVTDYGHFAAGFLAADKHHRAAATRAQVELERVTRERDEARNQAHLANVEELMMEAELSELPDLRSQLAALQSRNAALEAELAQARERERGLREALERIPHSHPNTPSSNHMESAEAGREVGWQDCREAVRKIVTQAALAGGKDGA